MSNTADILNKLRKLMPQLREEYAVKEIGLFGSYARGVATNKSDIDLLVEFDRPVGWEFLTLKIFLEDKLGVEVDLVTRNALKETLRESILEDLQLV
jgi:uncharacterized protein